MRAESVYRALPWCYPAAFRNEYASEMIFVFSAQLGEARRTGNRVTEARVRLRAARDMATIAPKEHSHVILQDLRHGRADHGRKPRLHDSRDSVARARNWR